MRARTPRASGAEVAREPDRRVARDARAGSTSSRRSARRSARSSSSTRSRSRRSRRRARGRCAGACARRRSGRRSRPCCRAAPRTPSSRLSPAASTVGPPELPCRTSPRTAVIVRATGPWPYASSLSTTRRRAEPAGHDRERAVLRVAEDRDRFAGAGFAQRQRPQRAAADTRSSATSFLRSNATTDRAGSSRARLRWRRRRCPPPPRRRAPR